jgi:hypothetical protein
MIPPLRAWRRFVQGLPSVEDTPTNQTPALESTPTGVALLILVFFNRSIRILSRVMPVCLMVISVACTVRTAMVLDWAVTRTVHSRSKSGLLLAADLLCTIPLVHQTLTGFGWSFVIVCLMRLCLIVTIAHMYVQLL